MSYKLYMGGFRYIQGVVIAKDEAEAEAKLREELRLGSFPCEFKEVDISGYVIVSKDHMENGKTSIPLVKPKKPKK